MSLRDFSKGDTLTTERLNPLVESARRTERLAGMPNAAALAERGPQGPIRVYVTARSVSGPARLSAHSYTVSDGAQTYSVDHTKLVVRVEPELIDGGGGRSPLGFVPAEVRGQGLAVDQEWRAWGLLYRGPAGTVGTDLAYAVELLGLCPWRNC